MPLPPLDAIPPALAAPSDYEPFARERMSAEAWAYFSGGAADEVTLRRNREAFDALLLHGRVLAGLGGNDTRVSLFGAELPFPVLLAPVAYQKMAHPQGELAAALGAGAVGTGMVVSTFASFTLEEIARQAPSPLCFQLYFQPDRAVTLDLVRRAEAAGYRAVVATVDAPVAAFRNREHRAAFRLPPGVDLANLRPYPMPPPPENLAALLAAAPRWEDIAWLRSVTKLPVLLKGVLSPIDAERALGEGLD
ncbi:MAG TPA: alpha-hydroxy acid oxidase, partial [Candidatus Methylacidiphilales bacterium]